MAAGAPRAGECRIGRDGAACRLGFLDDQREAVGRLIGQTGYVDEDDSKRIRSQVACCKKRIGATESENRRVAIMCRKEYGGPGRRSRIAEREPRGNAFFCQARQDFFGAAILTKLD